MSDERDHIDRWLEESQFPGAVDLEVKAIVDRINGLRRRFSRMLDETLSDFGSPTASGRRSGTYSSRGRRIASPSGSWPSGPSSRAER